MKVIKEEIIQDVKIDHIPEGAKIVIIQEGIQSNKKSTKSDLSSICRSYLEKGFDLKQWITLCKHTAIIEAIELAGTQTKASELLDIQRTYMSKLKGKIPHDTRKIA